jgi:hypothetical protein
LLNRYSGGTASKSSLLNQGRCNGKRKLKAGLYMGAVGVGIGHDDDFAVFGVADLEIGTNAGPDGVD